MIRIDPVLTHCPLQLIHADMLLRHVWFDYLAIMDQEARLSLYKASEAPVSSGDFSHQIVHEEQSGGSGDAAED